MKKALLIAFLILWGSAVATGQVVKLPEKVETQVGRLAAISIDSDGKTTNWVVVPPGNIDIFREYDPDPKVIRLRLIAYQNGLYSLVAWTAKGDVPSKAANAVCPIIVGGVPPTPPVPPNPVPPIPPAPDSTLLKDLRVAYAKESDGDKSLMGAYANTCSKTASAAAGLTTFASVNEFYSADLMSAVGLKCPNVRAVVNLYLNDNLPRSKTATIDPTSRAKIVDTFNELAAALASLGKTTSGL